MNETIINGVRFINLTPHGLNIWAGEEVYEIPASGVVARVSQTNVPCGEIGGIPVTRTEYGEVEGLPDSEDGTSYIVSALVGGKTNRNDIYIPGPAIRDDRGVIVGARGLMQI